MTLFGGCEVNMTVARRYGSNLTTVILFADDCEIYDGETVI